MANTIPIDQFESHFSNIYLEEGLALSENNTAWKVNVDSQGWHGTYKVKGMPPVHTQVFLANRFILGFECNCSEYVPIKGCRHIPALLYLRKNKASRLTDLNSSRKLSNDRLLEVVNNDELETFVRFYSNNNHSFSKIMKLFFLYKFYNNKEEFRYYLDYLVQSLLDPNGQINLKNKKILLQILDLQSLRIDDMIKQNNWTDAVYTNCALLEFFFDYFDITSTGHSDFLIKQLHNQLSILAIQNMAPALKGYFRSKLLDILNNPNYNQTGSGNLIEILMQLDPTQQNLDQVQESILMKVNKASTDEANNWIYLLFVLLNKTKTYNFATFYAHYLESDHILTAFVNMLMSDHEYQTQLAYILEARLRTEHRPLTHDLIKTISTFAIKQNLPDLFIKLVNHCLNANMEPSDIGRLTTIQQIANNDHFTQTLSDIKWYQFLEQCFPGILIQLLLKKGDTDTVIEHFNRLESIDTVASLTLPIIKNFKDEAYALIEQKILNYLSQYAGEQSKVAIEHLIYLLVKNGFSAHAEKLRRTIIDNFGQRKSLKDSLTAITI